MPTAIGAISIIANILSISEASEIILDINIRQQLLYTSIQPTAKAIAGHKTQTINIMPKPGPERRRVKFRLLADADNSSHTGRALSAEDASCDTTARLHAAIVCGPKLGLTSMRTRPTCPQLLVYLRLHQHDNLPYRLKHLHLAFPRHPESRCISTELLAHSWLLQRIHRLQQAVSVNRRLTTLRP